MTSLTAIFGNSDEKPEAESEKLLQLYWNRAELKKEFAELRNEKFRLMDLVKEKEGATARVQQKLDNLEQLLDDPKWVYNVIIHYQLRHLNRTCQRKLEKFAEQLKQQREQRQHSALVDSWNEQRAQEAEGVQARIVEQRIQVQSLEDKLQGERHRLATMSGFVRLFRGRSLTRSLDNLAERIHAIQHQEESLLREYDEVVNRVPPDTQGLDVATKRLINFMILAFAQELYMHFSPNDLVKLIKESGDKSVGAINYGDKPECDEIIAQVRKRTEALEKASDFADTMRKRAKLMADKAVFRNDSDAVPVSISVATIYLIDANGKVKEEEANLVGDNYWNLSEIFSR